MKRRLVVLHVLRVALLLACGTLWVGISEAAPVLTRCGAPLSSLIKTETIPTTTSSTSFVSIPGAALVVEVPAGQTRCLKLTFSASAQCDFNTAGNIDGDGCFIRATVNEVELHPQGTHGFAGDSRFLDSAHALHWVRRVAAGRHTVRIERRTFDSNTVFEIESWALDLEVTN